MAKQVGNPEYLIALFSYRMPQIGNNSLDFCKRKIQLQSVDELANPRYSQTPYLWLCYIARKKFLVPLILNSN